MTVEDFVRKTCGIDPKATIVIRPQNLEKTSSLLTQLMLKVGLDAEVVQWAWISYDPETGVTFIGAFIRNVELDSLEAMRISPEQVFFKPGSLYQKVKRGHEYTFFKIVRKE